MVAGWVRLLCTVGLPALFLLAPSSKQPAVPLKPLVKQSEYQVYVDQICHTYHLLATSQPGKFLPEDLYEWIGVDEKILDEYRMDPKFKDISLHVWMAAAPKLQQAILTGYDESSYKADDRQLVLDVSVVLMDKKTRSVYDGTFLPILRKPAAQRGLALRDRCKWED